MASEPEQPSFVGLLQVVIDEAGGIDKLAEATGVASATLRKWRTGKYPRSRIGGGVQAVHS